MGCVSSKDSRKTPARVSWYSSLSRNVSTSAHRPADSDEEDDSSHVVSLTSSSYGVLNMERSTCQGSFLNIQNRISQYQAIATSAAMEDDFVFSSGPDVKHMVACMGMKPVKQEDERCCLLVHDDGRGHGMETINTWELMEGLEEGGRTPSPLRGFGGGKLSLLDKPISFDTLQASHASFGETGSPVWKKYYTQDDMVNENLSFGGISPMPPSSPFLESPGRAPSHGSVIDLEDSRSISSIEPLDGSTYGLKILLSPANSPSHYVSPLTKKGGSHSASLSFDGNTEHLRKGFCNVMSPYRSPDVKRSSRKPSMDSVKGSGSPLFDPSLMATFEQALKATTIGGHDDWLQLNIDESATNSSSSDTTWASSETASDAESIHPWRRREKKMSASKIMPVDEEEERSKALLASYELKCPPRGEGKVVLYFTSLRGVRKTYEDCCTLRLILRGLGIHVDERDVWMHSKFKEELIDVLGDIVKGAPHVPRLFIKGRYIGGAEEVKQLHEEGVLAALMDGIATDMFHNVCDGCGDARFVPCLNCNGSCKVLNQYDEVSRCLDCNENGLIMCPICIT